MPRARTPLTKAKATGRTVHDPARFKSRREAKVDKPLGPPPKWMKNKYQNEAWRTFENEIPWLNRSHRALVAIASDMKGRIIAGEELSVAGYNLLRQCLNSMGATPADSSRVTLPEEKKDEQDPAAKYF